MTFQPPSPPLFELQSPSPHTPMGLIEFAGGLFFLWLLPKGRVR